MIPELNGDFLQWLRGFYYVAKTGSVRKAADLMHRNPSTISYQLKSLEEELGTVLFDRYKKSLIITQEGKKLLSWTITMFETLQSMRSSVGTMEGHLQGEVTVGTTLPVAVLAAPAITRFLQEFPDVHIHLHRALNLDIVNSVKESRVDFGLTGLTSLPRLENFEIFLKARPLLVARRDNPWHIPHIPTEEDLEQLPYIVFHPGTESTVYRPLHATARKYQKKILISLNNYHLVMQFVRSGLGVGIVDELCFKATMFGSDWSSIISYPLDHLLPNMLYGILTRRQKHISPQAKALMQVLTRHFSNLAARPLDDFAALNESSSAPGNRSADRKKAGKKQKEAKETLQEN